MTHADQRRWPFWPVVPLYPYGQRRTLRREIVPDAVWVFEQVQGIFYVIVPIRMIVVRLSAGGLLVYAPVAPTAECLSQLRRLESRYGRVKYIIHATVSGIEHKVFVGPFARACPEAQVYVTPDQWSFPLNLPLSWLGFPLGRTQFLPANSAETPFARDFDYATLGPIQLGIGPFAETVFFHKASKSLLVTDTLIHIPQQPPEILWEDPKPLLFHSRDNIFTDERDTPENRAKGWARIVLFALYFQPGALEVPGTGQAIQEATQARDRSKENYYGFYPFDWQGDWQTSFDAVTQQRLLIAPILSRLIFNRDPQAVQRWLTQVTAWPFEQVIACHFQAALPAGPADLLDAFQRMSDPAAMVPTVDWEFMEQLNLGLTRLKLTPPPAS